MSAREWAGEHPALAALAALLILAVAALGTLAALLGAAQGEARERQKTLEQMQKLAGQYAEAQDLLAARRSQAAGKGLSPETLDAIARRHGIVERSVTGRNLSQVKLDGRVEEQTITMTLARVTRKALAGFLNEVEQAGPAIHVRQLRVSATPGEPEIVDATVRISAYVAAIPNAK